MKVYLLVKQTTITTGFNKGINMQNTLDFTKPIQTRDGRKARIVSTGFEFEHDSRYSIIAEVEGEGYITYTNKGVQYYHGDSDLDLQNIPQETFEQKVERFKKSDYFVAEKTSSEWDYEVVTWSDKDGYFVHTYIEGAMEHVGFE